ncbi:MAG: hypothetical protein ACRC0G_03700 [Fusobacteriaceae bacterium]
MKKLIVCAVMSIMLLGCGKNEETIKTLKYIKVAEEIGSSNVEGLVEMLIRKESTIEVKDIVWEVQEKKGENITFKISGGNVFIKIKGKHEEDYLSFTYDNFVVYTPTGLYNIPQMMANKIQEDFKKMLNFN